jgi:hypothetical protein
MNEFDLRKFLYDNPLMEKKEDSKKGNKEMQKRMKGAIEDNEDHIEKLKGDIKADKKKLSKLKADEPKDVNESESVDELQANRKGDKGDSKIEKLSDNEMDPKDNKKLTKEGLKDMIRERITSILNEDEEVNVEDNEDINVDIEKEVDVDDESVESDIEVKSSLPGMDADTDAVLGLLTKASEEADAFSDDPELKTQIGNIITYFTRKHVAKV